MVESELLTGRARRDLLALASDFVRHIDGLGAFPPTVRIHGDLGMNNVLWVDGAPVLMDFDDSQNGAAVQDLALADWLYSVRDRPDLEVLGLWPDPTADRYAEHSRRRAGVRELLLEGYRSVRAYDPAWERWNQPCLFVREIFCAAWFCARAHDEAFMSLWGKSIDAAFWRRVIRLAELRLGAMSAGL